MINKGVIMTEFEKQYLLNLVKADYRLANIAYQEAIQPDNEMQFPQILTLAKQRTARENLVHIVKEYLRRQNK